MKEKSNEKKKKINKNTIAVHRKNTEMSFNVEQVEREEVNS